MAGEIIAGTNSLVMDPNDHVATVLLDLAAGEIVNFRVRDEILQVTLLEPIPFGHKVAITELPEGSHVCKYGEVIGRATVEIHSGQHVHVHNVEGIRGRGDQPTGGMKQ